MEQKPKLTVEQIIGLGMIVAGMACTLWYALTYKSLEQQLAEAVAREDYESAATIRDLIKLKQ